MRRYWKTKKEMQTCPHYKKANPAECKLVAKESWLCRDKQRCWELRAKEWAKGEHKPRTVNTRMRGSFDCREREAPVKVIRYKSGVSLLASVGNFGIELILSADEARKIAVELTATARDADRWHKHPW